MTARIVVVRLMAVHQVVDVSATLENSVVDLAWAAGYFDGEGMVRIARDKRNARYSYTVRVAITNTYKPSLVELQERFGGSVHPQKKMDYRKERQSWHWDMTSSNAYKFLCQILPYLREKAPQARAAIEFYELYGGYANSRTLEQKADQGVRYQAMKEMKVVEYSIS